MFIILIQLLLFSLTMRNIKECKITILIGFQFQAGQNRHNYYSKHVNRLHDLYVDRNGLVDFNRHWGVMVVIFRDSIPI